MLTFKPLDVYDVNDPEQSLVEALREYPELREFEDVLIEDENVATILQQGPREFPKETIREALSDYGSKPSASKKAKKPKASKKTKEPKVPYFLTAEGSKAMDEVLAKAEGLSQYLQAKGLQEKPREESPKGIWDKLDLL